MITCQLYNDCNNQQSITAFYFFTSNPKRVHEWHQNHSFTPKMKTSTFWQVYLPPPQTMAAMHWAPGTLELTNSD